MYNRLFAKYGHDCEVDSNLTKLKIYQPETSEITRCMFNLRCVNEVYWEGNQFLKSQWNTEIEHFKHAKFIYLIHPFSKIRKWWEMFMALIFLLQFITIPLEMASVQGYGTNKPHHQLFFQAGRFILDCSCLVDICMTCCTGYCDYNKREVIMHPLGIIRHYVQKFLFVDIVSSIPESLISYLLTSHEARARYKSTSDPKNINVIRVIITHISMIKVLRMVTFMHYCRHYLDLGRRSRKGAVFLRLLLVFVVCLLLVHLMICAAISVAHYYEPETIIKDDGVIKFSEVRDYVFVPKHGDDTQLHGSDSFTFTEFYIRYFYETIIMLSRTGTGFRRVRSLFVNVYVSIIWFSSLIVYFIIIAYIMGVVTTHNASKHKYIEMVQQLREYMRYKQLPEHIQRRLIRNYEFRFQKTYFRENVILATISGHLRQEIVMHSCRKLVEDVVFFKNLPTRLLVHIVSCLQVEVFLENDVIARANTVGDAMYFIATGTVAVYTPNGLEICHLDDGHHFGEIAMVKANQRRVASVVAAEMSEMYRLDRDDFTRAVLPFPEVLTKIEHVAHDRMEQTAVLNYETVTAVSAQKRKEILHSKKSLFHIL